MDEFEEMLARVRKKPVINLGLISLVRLKAFLDGYVTYIHDTEDENFQFYPGFQEFVAEKYEIKVPAHWSKIIQLVTTTDEQAFYLFFELLDEFKGNTPENPHTMQP